MEPIYLCRDESKFIEWYADHATHVGLPRAEYDALVKERDEATRKWNAAVYDADKVRAERDRAEREWHAATARAEKAEADQRMLHFLQDAAKHPGNAELLRALRDLGCDQPAGDPVKMVFIHSPRAFHAPTPDDRKGEDGEAIDAAGGE